MKIDAAARFFNLWYFEVQFPRFNYYILHILTWLIIMVYEMSRDPRGDFDLIEQCIM